MRILLNQGNVDPVEADFPFGKIRNSNGLTEGTFLSEQVLGDMITGVTKMANVSGVIPDGDRDNESNGYQLLEAQVAFMDRIANQGFTIDIAPTNTNILVPLGNKELTVIRSGTNWTIAGLPFIGLADTSVYQAIASANYVVGDTFNGLTLTTTGGWLIGNLVRFVKVSSSEVKAEKIELDIVDSSIPLDNLVKIAVDGKLIDAGISLNGLLSTNEIGANINLGASALNTAVESINLGQNANNANINSVNIGVNSVNGGE